MPEQDTVLPITAIYNQFLEELSPLLDKATLFQSYHAGILVLATKHTVLQKIFKDLLDRLAKDEVEFQKRQAQQEIVN